MAKRLNYGQRFRNYGPSLPLEEVPPARPKSKKQGQKQGKKAGAGRGRPQPKAGHPLSKSQRRAIGLDAVRSRYVGDVLREVDRNALARLGAAAQVLIEHIDASGKQSEEIRRARRNYKALGALVEQEQHRRAASG